ncbi:MAG TPA: hypothetical protein VIC35_13165 [Acidimicrobiia bacterium]|jgi:hypothetical protein
MLTGTTDSGSQDPHAAPPSKVGPVLRWTVAVMMFGAAGIHFAMMGEHAGVSWSHGMFFAVAAWSQVGLAAWLIFRPSKLACFAGIALNLGILGVWLYARLWGIAIGSNGAPEKFGKIDGLCAAFEIIAVVALVTLLLTRTWSERSAPSAFGFIGVATVGVAVAALTSLAFSPAISSSTAAAATTSSAAGACGAAASPDGHTHQAVSSSPGCLVKTGPGLVVTGALTGKSPCEESGPPASVGQVGSDAEGHEIRGPFLQLPTSQATTEQLEQAQENARAVATRYPTVAAAENAGYRESTVYVPCIGAHYTNIGLAARPFDPSAPSELLYDGTQPTSRIVGLSYLLFHPGGPPPGFPGPNDHWHQHNFNGGLCIGNAGIVIGAETTSQQACEAKGGHKIPLNGVWMLHDWVVPGFECTWGPFAGECPELGGRVGGTAWEPPKRSTEGQVAAG